MTVLDDDVSRAWRTSLVEELVDAGHLADPLWREAFRVVPRHSFTPALFVAVDGGYRSLHGSIERDAWLRAVYSDEPVVTQVEGRHHADDLPSGTTIPLGPATCSSSQPSLMSAMLHHFDLQDGMRVLEIGTGTGYQAALLSQRLGASRVTSLEYDSGLARTAAQRLADVGHPVEVITGDGACPGAGAGAYDGLIATCAFPHIPPAWLRLIAPGGTILLNLQRPLAAGLLTVLRVRDPQAADGQLAPDYAGFMPTREQHHYDLGHLYREAARNETASRTTALPATALDDDGFLAMAALAVPAEKITVHIDASPDETWLLAGDGSYACHRSVGPGEFTVSEGGPQWLWSSAERLYQQWNELGRPTRDQFRIAVDQNDVRVYLGEAGQPCWQIDLASKPQ